jgi:hypothetical protein
MRAYWNQLRRDDGKTSNGWVSRLKNADILPFPIQGDELFEEGLVDPNIVDYIEGDTNVCK